MSQPPLRALMISAHPDDCEFRTGGLAAKYRRRGDIVKFVSATNGNAGHHLEGGGPLARRRAEECRQVAAVADIDYEVLANDDGRLVADLSTRDVILRVIRQFAPDIVFTHRPNDYHPDHRATGVLVQDASYLIRVPNICPETPHLSRTPVICYMTDYFQKPAPFTPDVVVALDDDALNIKARMLHCHTSQVYEWLPYDGDYEAEIPSEDFARLAWITERTRRRDGVAAERFRSAVIARYGEDTPQATMGIEAFEISEYGRALNADEIDTYFPR